MISLNKMKTILYISLMATVILSCKKVIDFDDAYQTPKNVLNCIFDLEDDTLELFLTRSQEIYGFDQNFEKLQDADIALLKDDVEVTQFDFNQGESSINYSDWDYGARYLAKINNADFASTYKVYSNHPVYGACYGETVSPTKVEIDAISIGYEKVTVWGYLEEVLVAYITFTDPAGEDNYYRISDAYTLEGSIYSNYIEVNGEWQEVKNDTVYVHSEQARPSYDQVDPLLVPNDDDIFGYVENYHLLFTDELIDGKTYTLKYVLGSGSDNESFGLDTANGEFLQAHLTLQSIPQDLYLYYSTLDAYYWNGDMPFMEPVHIFSNIENGVGIVAAYRDDAESFLFGRKDRDDIEYVDYEERYYY